MKKLLSALLVASALSFTSVGTSAPANSAIPNSVIHVVTVNFKKEATPEQIQAAVDGVKKLPSQFKGITRVWTRVVKNQTDKSHIFVMEFANEQALKDYADSDAQKEWYKVYLPIRQQSKTSDITN